MKEFFVKKSIFCLSSFLFLLAFTLFLISGCSKSEDSETADGTAAETAGKETVSAAVGETSSAPVEKTAGPVKPAELDKAVEAHIQKIQAENQEIANAEAPQQMTYFFIRALQMENEEAVLGMLTQDAYREMKRLQGETGQKGIPCPDFIKTSEVMLGNVQYLSDENDEEKIVGAHVGTIWKVPSENGFLEENIAWVFRFEEETWLIAGMLSIVDPKYPPILINFENMEDTEEQAKLWQEEVERIDAGIVSQEDAAEAPAAENAPAEENAAENAETAEGTETANGPKAEIPGELPGELPGALSDELPAELPAEL